MEYINSNLTEDEILRKHEWLDIPIVNEWLNELESLRTIILELNILVERSENQATTKKALLRDINILLEDYNG